MNRAKTVFTVLFYVALFGEAVVNLMNYLGLLFFGNMSKFSVFCLAFLGAGVLVSFLLALLRRWFACTISSAILGGTLLGCSIYLLRKGITPLMFWTRHAHIVLPALLAALVWFFGWRLKKRRELAEYRELRSRKTIA